MERFKNLCLKFIDWVASDELSDNIKGDLEEVYYRSLKRNGKYKALFIFLLEGIACLKLIQNKNYKISNIGMLRLNFIFFIRSLRRNWKYSLINISGLMLGLMVFIFILSYIYQERNYDTYHTHPELIYRITSQKIQDGDVQKEKSSTSVILADHLRTSYQDITTVSQIHSLDARRQIVRVFPGSTYEQTYVETRGFHADNEFFNIFSDRLLAGDQATALIEPNSIVLTEKLARKYFGNEEPIGKTIEMVDDMPMTYQVTGVVENVSKNSHFQYDYLISYSTYKKQHPNWRWTAWDWDNFHTYIKIKPGVSPDWLENQINNSVAIAAKEVFKARGYVMKYSLQNIREIHLYSNLIRELSPNGNGELVKYLEVLAYFVLILAWVNYINLSTARSTLRAKEVGVRKITGVRKEALIMQLLFEAVLLNALALVISTFLLQVCSSWLALVTDFTFDVALLLEFNTWVILLAILIVGSLLSGFYPALVLSSFEPLKIVKGNFKSSKEGTNLRKALVVFQAVTTIVLIVGTYGVVKQFDHLISRELGMNLEQVIVVDLPNERNDDFWIKYDRFKEQISNHISVKNVTATNFLPGEKLNHVELLKQANQSAPEAKVTKHGWIDFDFIKLFDMKVITGRTYERGRASDAQNKVIINESAVKLIGYQDPEEVIGKHVTWIHSYGTPEDFTVIGVVKDHVQDAMKGAEPMTFYMNRFSRWTEVYYMSIKVSMEDFPTVLQHINEVYDEVYPEDSFDYAFLDESFHQHYDSIKNFGSVLSLFTVIAIVVSNLGLFGLISFILIQRKKEISVRKVLGAGLKDIVKQFSGQFAIQLILALIIAIPLVYYALHTWLEQFAYRITVTPLLFIVPIGMVSIIFVTTVLYNTIAASQANPAANLRDE